MSVSPKIVTIDSYSQATSRLDLFCNGIEIGTATGFFWKHGDRLFLVSNWHVFSGRKPSSGQPINKDGAVPDLITATFRSKDIAGNMWGTIEISVNNQDTTNWIQHAQFGQQIDIAAHDLTFLFINHKLLGNPCDPIPMNELPSMNDALISIGSDVFILGYPDGIESAGVLPIWKRGSVASEFDMPLDGASAFAIDSATRPGMSGAPVIARFEGVVPKQDGGTAFTTGGSVKKFLGIYSGRYHGESNDAQLGKVWKRSLIEEVVAEGIPGKHELQQA